MSRKVAGRVSRPRLCARCKGPMSESRPVFLVADHGGKITGPYHAGCAERVKLGGKSAYQQGELAPEVFGQIVPKASGEAESW